VIRVDFDDHVKEDSDTYHRNEIVLLHLTLPEVSVNAVNITNLPRYDPMRSLVQELHDLLVGNKHFCGPFLSLLYEHSAEQETQKYLPHSPESPYRSGFGILFPLSLA
jgi:hypothetical protein